MKETQELSEFVYSTSLNKVPDRVLNLVKDYILDLIGVGIFATKTPWGKIIIDFCRENSASGNSTIFGVSSERYKPLLAALANGTCAHGFELDDVHSPSISHPGAVTIPAALSLGETCNASGKKLLESVIVGYEVMGRIGAVISKSHIAKGFHPTGTFGVFGAGAACSKILDLSREEIQDAFGIAGSSASGIMQFSIGGSMVKRIHAGNAAEQGMKSALLARKGFTGPREILEGKYGFFRVFTDIDGRIDWGEMLKGLGKKYMIEEISTKSSPACNILHPVVDCIEWISTKRKINEDQVEEILVSGHENLIHEHNTYEPDSILSAQYSLPFTVGLAIKGKIHDPSVYLDESILKNKEILKIGSKVKTKLDDNIQKAFPGKFGAKVSIKFGDGEIIEKMVSTPKGSYDNPFSQDELEIKFRTLVRDSLEENKADLLIRRIYSIESLKNIRELFRNIY
jgi:2-methylcitrate dehydratase PrpD